MADYRIFLDAPEDVRLERRAEGGIKNVDSEYVDQVLNPMHNLHVKPSRIYAHKVIQTANKSKEQVLDIVCKSLVDRGIVRPSQFL